MRRCSVVVMVVAALAACSSASAPSTTTTTLGTTTTGSSTSSTPTSSSSPATMTVQVFFLDVNAYNVGRPPYTRAVERTVAATTPADGALRALFVGPTAEEAAGGLHLVTSGATGFADLAITNGTARVRLTGGCSSGGSTFTIADELAATLRQFTAVEVVKVFDPDGTTEVPDAPGDSIPTCLEP